MSDEGNIFYSQVDLNLQSELNTRGKAGMHDRSERSLNYMLEKVANVELIAMTDQKHLDTEDVLSEKKILHRLGGSSVRSGEYLPTGNNGFLKERVTKISNPASIDGSLKERVTQLAKSVVSNKLNEINSSYRIPPFLTSAEMQLNDHSMGLLNSATVNIIIPNPDRDLDFMESVYARPGRAITMIIEHPDSAVITNQFLQNNTIQPSIVGKSLQKMNRVSFNGLIKSFTYGYQPDGTVAMTIYLIGTSNVYTDVSMYIYKPDAIELPGNAKIPPLLSPVTTIAPTALTTALGPQPAKPSSFYKQIYDEVNSLYLKSTDPTVEVKTAYLQATEIVNESTYEFTSNDMWWAVMNDWNKKEQRYITLAYLINFLNKYIITKQHSIAPNALIICSDLYCESNYLTSLISANPIDIWITGGTHDTYGKPANTPTTTITSKKWWSDKNSMFTDQPPFSKNSKSFPSRININLEVINRILVELLKTPDNFKATNFLMEISKIISEATGNFINMKLISYPENPDYLIYYDANFKGANSHNVKPYSIPMFSNHPNGTIVRDFKFESKLPQDMQALMYTVNQSDTISEEKIAPFLNYMYNNREITRAPADTLTGIAEEFVKDPADETFKLALDAKYAESHKTYLDALDVASAQFIKDGLTNKTTQVELSNALIKHIQWPTSKIDKSALMTAATYPMEASFTIDGINGFRYGDTVEFEALPGKYKNNTTFSIIGITHTVNTAGEWTTNINCIMRPKFD